MKYFTHRLVTTHQIHNWDRKDEDTGGGITDEREKETWRGDVSEEGSCKCKGEKG